MQTEIKKGENVSIEPRWYHIFLILTVLPAWILLAVATVLILIADFILLDTHHTTVKIEPKWKNKKDAA